jgi:hypothetical protein
MRTDNEVERRLKAACLVEPSDQLKSRTLTAATSAWHGAEVQVAWWVPAKRLMTAAVIAILSVYLADFASDQAGTDWQTVREIEMEKPEPSAYGLDDATYQLFVGHTIAAPRQVDAAAIREYYDQVHRELDEES